MHSFDQPGPLAFGNSAPISAISHVIQAQPPDHLIEPRKKRPVRVERSPRPEGSGERLLRQVQRVFVRPDQAEGHPVRAPHVHLDERAEGSAISRLGSHQKGAFSGGLGVQVELL